MMEENSGEGVRGIDWLEELNSSIPAFDRAAEEACQARWNSIAKPLHSLGLLESYVAQIAGLTGDLAFRPTRRAIAVFCADNGVVAQGVTQTGSEVTAAVARNMAEGRASVCRMAAVARAEVLPIDIGMNEPQRLPGILDRRVMAGTRDMSLGPAMSREEATAAVQTGIRLAKEFSEQGHRLLLTGEMGIGNTTTSSAVAAVLLGRPPETLTGRGAGLSSEGLRRKIAVIGRAIAVNRPDPDDPLDTLAKVGGLDIAGMAGLILGGAKHRVPVLIDGMISAVAALVALRLCPVARAAVLASHCSAEPAGRLLLEALELRPLITAGMFLGEGSGAVAALPLLDMAYAVYDGMPTFAQAAIDDYLPLD